MGSAKTKVIHWIKTAMGVLIAFALALALLWISTHQAQEHGVSSLEHLVLTEFASALLGAAFIWIAFDVWKNLADDEVWEQRIQSANDAWKARTASADKLWQDRLEADKESWNRRATDWQNMLDQEQSQWEARIETLANNSFWGLLNNDMPQSIRDSTRNLILDCSFYRSNFHVQWDIQHFIDSNYEETEFECLLIHSNMSYRVTNISRKPKKYPIFILLPNPIDDRLKRQCKLHYINYKREKDKDVQSFVRGTISYLVDSSGKIKNSSGTQKGEPYVRYPPNDDDFPPVELAPGESIYFDAMYTMAKKLEDSEFQQSVFPSLDMKVTVADRTGDAARRIFARPIHPRPVIQKEPTLRTCPTYVFELQGSVLPHQGILIWWEFAGMRETYSASRPQ